MVNLTQICMKYMPVYLRRPDTRTVYFRRQALFRLTGTLYGLSRNVWRVAIRKWHKKLEYKAEYRQRREKLLYDLHSQRLLAACTEHGIKIEYFISNLTKCNVELSTKMLANLAIYEPRTFKCLVDLAKTNFNEEESLDKDHCFQRSLQPSGSVITRNMLRD